MRSKLQKTIASGAALSGFAAVLFFSSCGLLEVAGTEGGSSSEVVAVVGVARNADNTAAAQATVLLRPADYLSGTPAEAGGKAQIANVETDGKGAFRIDSVKPGVYTIEVADRKSTGAVRTISATLDSAEVHLEPMLLKPIAKLSGTARLPAGAPGPVYIMVYGLERRVLADSMGSFAFNDLPEGRFAVRISPVAEAVGSYDLPKIAVVAGGMQTIDTVTLHTFVDEDYSAWASSRSIRINTSPSGADVAATVVDFPLLVRLDAGSFDFSASLAYRPGTDIRFAGPGGRHLPCQIERWDPVLHKAEIWVRVDSVSGNDSTQLITMYCGNPTAASWAGTSVFDTAAGFAAVWHLGDDLDDATVNHNNGVSMKTAVTEGLAGTCRYFDGSSSFIGIDSSLSLDMAGKGPTILLWERSSGVYTNERMFFEHEIWPDNGDYGFSARSNTTLSFDYPYADSEVWYAGASLSDNAWHLVAASRDAASGRGTIYLDGDAVANGPMGAAIGPGSGRSFIGSRGGTNRFFEGYIDEMWILSRPPSGGFIKLAYENQRPGQKLVRVLP